MTGKTMKRVILEFRVFNEPAMRAASGFNDTLREPVLTPTADGLGKTARDDHTNLFVVHGQIKSGSKFFLQRQAAGGDTPEVMLQALISKRELLRVGLIDKATRRLMLIKNDRLLRIKDRLGKVMIDADNPGLYIVEADETANGGNMVRYLLNDRTEAA